jgi:hypothetical protein
VARGFHPRKDGDRPAEVTGVVLCAGQLAAPFRQHKMHEALDGGGWDNQTFNAHLNMRLMASGFDGLGSGCCAIQTSSAASKSG